MGRLVCFVLGLSMSFMLIGSSHGTPRDEVTMRYSVDVELSAMDGHISGSVDVLFVNRSAAPLDTLQGYLILDDGYLDTHGMAMLPVEATGLFKVISDDSRIFLMPLRTPIQPGESRTFRFDFHGKVPMDEKYHEGAVAACWFWHPILSAPVDPSDLLSIFSPATFEVSLTAPAHHNVAITADSRTDSVGADGRKYISAHIQRARVAIWISSNNYSVTRVSSPGGDIRIYYSESEARQGPFVAEVASQVSAFYAHLIGEFPFPHVCMVPGRRDVTGGGNVGPRVLMLHKMHELPTPGDDKSVVATHRIVAHELAHLYWGEFVQMDLHLGLGLGMWLDQQYTESIGEIATIQRNDFRIYVDAAKAGHNLRMDQTPEELQKADFNVNKIMWHGKGYSIVSMLDYVIARDSFASLIKEIVAGYGGTDKTVGEEDLRRLAERKHGTDLGWFFQQWLHTNAVLDYAVGEVIPHNGGLSVEVRQLTDAVMPVDVELITKSGSHFRKRTTRSGKSERVYFEERDWARIVLDPDERLPDIDRSNNEMVIHND